jgi:hypothetical protein
MNVTIADVETILPIIQADVQKAYNEWEDGPGVAPLDHCVTAAMIEAIARTWMDVNVGIGDVDGTYVTIMDEEGYQSICINVPTKQSTSTGCKIDGITFDIRDFEVWECPE